MVPGISGRGSSLPQGYAREAAGSQKPGLLAHLQQGLVLLPQPFCLPPMTALQSNRGFQTTQASARPRAHRRTGLREIAGQGEGPIASSPICGPGGYALVSSQPSRLLLANLEPLGSSDERKKLLFSRWGGRPERERDSPQDTQQVPRDTGAVPGLPPFYFSPLSSHWLSHCASLIIGAAPVSNFLSHPASNPAQACLSPHLSPPLLSHCSLGFLLPGPGARGGSPPSLWPVLLALCWSLPACAWASSWMGLPFPFHLFSLPRGSERKERADPPEQGASILLWVWDWVG